MRSTSSCFGGDSDAAQHASRHFAEHCFNDVEPRAMFGCEGEFESVRVKTEPALRLLGNMRGVIVEQQANTGLTGVDLMQFSKKGTDCSVPARKLFKPRGAAAVDRVVCPLFQHPARELGPSAKGRHGLLRTSRDDNYFNDLHAWNMQAETLASV